MNSTSRRTCTGFVPESITGDIAAGQDSGDRYRSRLEMNRTTGFSNQGKRHHLRRDQRIRVVARPDVTRRDATRFVPDLYRRIAQTLALIVAATLLPAAGIAIGTVGAEIAHRASAEQAAAEYPTAHPTAEQVQVLAETLATVPTLDADWRWAELDSRGSCGVTIQRARIVLLDPGMGCDLTATIYHEWAHVAEVVYYGGDATPEGEIVSDLTDEVTGKPYVIDVQEAVADCASVLLLDEFDLGPRQHSYLPRLGGCAPEQLALARDIVTNAGVKLTPGKVSALGSVGAGVA